MLCPGVVLDMIQLEKKRQGTDSEDDADFEED